MLHTPLNLKPAYRIKNKSAALDNKLNSKLHNTNELKERLLKEMLELDKQRQNLEIGAQSVDFSMVQTYKEMIQSRRILLDQLSRSIG